MHTLRPASTAMMAALRPALPPPITSTSKAVLRSWPGTVSLLIRFLSTSVYNDILGCSKRISTGVVENRSEEHTSELQSLMRNSSAVCCLQKKKTHFRQQQHTNTRI